MWIECYPCCDICQSMNIEHTENHVGVCVYDWTPENIYFPHTIHTRPKNWLTCAHIPCSIRKIYRSERASEQTKVRGGNARKKQLIEHMRACESIYLYMWKSAGILLLYRIVHSISMFFGRNREPLLFVRFYTLHTIIYIEYIHPFFNGIAKYISAWVTVWIFFKCYVTCLY